MLTPENDSVEVGEVVEQKREELEEGTGFHMPGTALPLSRARAPAWRRTALPAQLPLFSGQLSFFRNLTSKGSPSKQHESFSLDK